MKAHNRTKAPSADFQSDLLDNMTFENITPELAAEYLDANITTNRTLSDKTITRYARDMREGDWHPEAADPIRFDTSGHLIDGQHRLRAVLIAKKTIPMLVIRNVDPNAIHSIDTGRARRPADMLKISGFTNTNLLASAARLLLLVKAGPLTPKGGRFFSHNEIFDTVSRHPKLQYSCAQIRAIRGIRPSHQVAVHYIGRELLGLPQRADKYLHVFQTGIPAYEGCPAHLFREWLLRERFLKSRPTEGWMFMTMVHTWNLFAKEKPLQVIKTPKTVVFDRLDTDQI